MQVAPYEPADALEIVKLWRESFEFGVRIVDPNPVQEQLDFLLNEVVPNSEVAVVKDAGRVVAFMASVPESVCHLYVSVRHLGQGIGSHLLGLAKAKSIGSLWLYTFARNSNARCFYERHGFKEVERESENMYKMEAIKYKWLRSASEA